MKGWNPLTPLHRELLYVVKWFAGAPASLPLHKLCVRAIINEEIKVPKIINLSGKKLSIAIIVTGFYTETLDI